MNIENACLNVNKCVLEVENKSFKFTPATRAWRQTKVQSSLFKIPIKVTFYE